MKILNKELNPTRLLSFELTRFYGVGRSLARSILNGSGVDDRKVADVTTDQALRISAALEKVELLEYNLRNFEKENILRLVRLKCYRGSRHVKCLPQSSRTSTNARTTRRLGRRYS